MTDFPILRAQNLCKSFYNPQLLEILNGISLEIFRGQSVAIMGRSGEGKSTLLQILGTLDKPCVGELFIAGKEVTFKNTSEIRNRHLGFIFQSFHLLEDYTTLENVLMPARIARKPSQSGSLAYLQAVSFLEKVGLGTRLHHFGRQLSGGEKQRVAIARAFCNDPDLILADEPSGNLDRKTAQGIHDMLLSMVREKGKSLIVVTHDQELAKLCDQVFILKDGSLTSSQTFSKFGNEILGQP